MWNQKETKCKRIKERNTVSISKHIHFHISGKMNLLCWNYTFIAMHVSESNARTKNIPFSFSNFFFYFFPHSQIQYWFLFPLCVDFHLTFIKHAATSMTTHSVPFEFDTFCFEFWRICAWVCLSTVQTIKHTGDWWCMRYAHFTHINSHITVATLEINGRNACNKVSF